jgi:hypothetical protein
MKLDDLIKFNEIDFDNMDIPVFVENIEKNYDSDMEKHNYVLEQSCYDEYASKWARVYDWYGVQYARSKYNLKNLENLIDEIYDTRKKDAPAECKTDASKKRWVQENFPDFYISANRLARAHGHFLFFENKLKSCEKKHYLCKSMSSSIDKDKPIGGF